MKDNFKIVSLTRQDIPEIVEDVKTRYNWVPVGIIGQDDYFPIITDSYQTSTTNAACIEGIADLIYGKGLYSENEAFNEKLKYIVGQRDIKKVAFDTKLYGNAAFQVIWNKEHTTIKKLFHIPIQHLRAEKIYDSIQVQNYYYCSDWSDHKAQKDKRKIPAFGTSQEQIEVLYIKDYTPGKFYYSLPD